jgi:GNAT superfamily N-acetyltransferase
VTATTARKRPRDWQRALSLTPQPKDRIVARRGRTEILLVIHREDTRKRRSRGYLVTWWHRKDLRYGAKLHDPADTSTEIDYHVFIARQDGMGVGALLAARAQYGGIWLQWKRPGSKQPHQPARRQPASKPRWKFGFIGVLATRRKRGIAKLLLNTAAKYFGTEVCAVAWGLPFQPDGEALVRRLCPRGFWSG